MKAFCKAIGSGLFLVLFSCVPLARAQDFVHPGGLHTQADLDRMKAKVAAGEHPWIDGWNLFIQDPKAQNTWRARPASNMGSRQKAQDDATAMYYNTLRWYISGDSSYAECAVRIANDWAATVRDKPYGDDLSGIPIGSFALAAEVLRIYPGWSKTDFKKFKEMMVKYWYPKSSDFLRTHRGDPVSRSWANWDACNMVAVLGIAVLCDDRKKFDEAVEYFKDGAGMGSIKNAVPFVYPGELGQWQEAGRDFAHTMGGQGLLAEFCQVGWNQGQDLFGYDDNRLLKGAEYAAQYTLWRGVPYTFYNNADNAMQFYVSENYHGRLDASHFELLYNHYVVRKGLKAPNVKSFAELRRPEPGEIDIFGYGTLTFTLDAGASPYPAVEIPSTPGELTATAGVGRVDLKWSPSGAYNVQGYEVSRATERDGPYTSIYSTTRWTTPRYTDTKVENGTTFYYKVSAINQTGTSVPSSSVSATPVAAGDLAEGWKQDTVGKPGTSKVSTYAAAANNSFNVTGGGSGIGSTGDNCNFVSHSATGDFALTARLIGRRGAVPMTGLMVRESLDEDARAMALTLGELGGRQARFRTRSLAGEKPTLKLGNDYTWMPVWFRLQRVGDIFTAYQSSDGIEWFLVGSSTVALPKICLVGLMVSSGDNVQEKESEVTFDNVLLGVAPLLPPSPPEGLVATATGNGLIGLSWKNTASQQAGIKIEASIGKKPFYEIADLAANATSFVNVGLKDLASYRYRVRAYNTGGYSSYSNITDLGLEAARQQHPQESSEKY